MAKAIALYEGGIHSRVEVAVREDGQKFERHQYRDPRYGYRWTAWRAFGEKLGENMRANLEATMSRGFSTLFLRTDDLRVRLP